MMIRVIDFETTGLPPNAAIVEIGWQDIDTVSGFGGAETHLINPGVPIPPEASAIHHIIDADVASALTKEEVRPALLSGAEAFAAHHATFEKAFFGGGGLPWICTLKAARRVWPNAPSHSNQALRYWLKLDADRSLASPPHRAGPDAYVTALLLQRLLAEGVSFEQMVEWEKLPSLLPKVEFGKHRGKQWRELPLDYLEWIINKSDMDDDTKYTARHYLQEAADAR